MKSIGLKFKAIREAKGMLQKDFARYLAVKPSYISQIESGKKTPSDTLVVLLKLMFGVSGRWWEAEEGDMFAIDALSKALVEEMLAWPPEMKAEKLEEYKELRQKKQAEEKE